MKRTSTTEPVAGGNRGEARFFSGEVNIGTFFPAREVASASVNVVAFSAGARTHWHRHSGGQVLHVVSGSGSTQERGGDVQSLRPGDLVAVDSGVWHWHGSDGSHPMTHVAISLGDADWGDAVE